MEQDGTEQNKIFSPSVWHRWDRDKISCWPSSMGLILKNLVPSKIIEHNGTKTKITKIHLSSFLLFILYPRWFVFPIEVVKTPFLTPSRTDSLQKKRKIYFQRKKIIIENTFDCFEFLIYVITVYYCIYNRNKELLSEVAN